MARVPGSTKQVRRAGYDRQAGFATHLRLGGAVEREHCRVAAADDQQCRGNDPGKSASCEVGSTASRDDGRHVAAGIGGRPQGCRRAGAGAEVADRQTARCGLGAHPPRRTDEPLAQAVDVEDVGAVQLLGRGEQVEQLSADSRLVEDRGDISIACAMTAASTAMGEEHDAERSLWDGQVSSE
jgi:hypothetical protein